MKKIIILNIIAIFLASCSDENNKSGGVNIDVDVNIYLENSMGENLIDTDNYQSANFKIYFYNNSVKEYLNPPNFFIINENNIVAMRLFLNDNKNEENPVTYIKWNETDTDTLKAHFNRSRGNNENVICDKVWLNDKLVWDISMTSGVLGREITIVK